jgi:AraC-like DNA-binding protein
LWSGLGAVWATDVRDAKRRLEATGASVLVTAVDDPTGSLVEPLVAQIEARAPRMVVCIVVARGAPPSADLASLSRYAVCEVVRDPDANALPTLVTELAERASARARLNAAADEAAGRFGGEAQVYVRKAVELGLEAMRVPQFAALLGLTLDQLETRVSRACALTPSDLLMWGRLVAAAVVMEGSLWTCERVAHTLGFSSSSAFCNSMKRRAGATPDTVRHAAGSFAVIDKLVEAARDGLQATRRHSPNPANSSLMRAMLFVLSAASVV